MVKGAPAYLGNCSLEVEPADGLAARRREARDDGNESRMLRRDLRREHNLQAVLVISRVYGTRRRSSRCWSGCRCRCWCGTGSRRSTEETLESGHTTNSRRRCWRRRRSSTRCRRAEEAHDVVHDPLSRRLGRAASGRRAAKDPIEQVYRVFRCRHCWGCDLIAHIDERSLYDDVSRA